MIVYYIRLRRRHSLPYGEEDFSYFLWQLSRVPDSALRDYSVARVTAFLPPSSQPSQPPPAA
jgi:hypothetical protein